MKQSALPQHLEPARAFYDALAEMIAKEVLRKLRAGEQAMPANTVDRAALGDNQRGSR
jgi:hypothetical protein